VVILSPWPGALPLPCCRDGFENGQGRDVRTAADTQGGVPFLREHEHGIIAYETIRSPDPAGTREFPGSVMTPRTARPPQSPRSPNGRAPILFPNDPRSSCWSCAGKPRPCAAPAYADAGSAGAFQNLAPAFTKSARMPSLVIISKVWREPGPMTRLVFGPHGAL
jgi:hypothetical protein